VWAGEPRDRAVLPGLRRAGRQQQGPLGEERKTVTVLFCDLVGFTAASDRADPEDVRARIRPCHARLRQVVEGFGGTVEKFIGDAVMAVFGAPVAHEDDPERAVRAGLRILEAIADLNAAVTARALLAEHHGQHAEAAALFTAAAERWERFEVPWEQAQALLGQGRCLLSVGQLAEARAPLHTARAIFATLRAKPALADVDRLLVQATTATA